MNFKTSKLIYIILLIVTLMVIPTHCYAFGDIVSGAKDFLNLGNGQDSIIAEDALKTASDTVYNVLLGIAVILAIGVGAFLGIQLMLQGAEGKAQIKEALLPYVIGCVVAFAAFGLWKVVVTMAQNLEM